ncbi:hypothetical protein ACH429_15225 [Streptomyces pathocidini]|uniref:Uncharacterized protein n=1 Tax=Streptomyces pathocidini TaxID=1650571 RepID=A0ABW7US47_9ACTN|nr:hypothetical protein [Streptomyces pathocidini]
MLAQLPLSYLLLIATAATLTFCLYMDRWLKVRKLAVAFLVISPACCLGMVIAGGLQYQQWSLKQMLIMYSFTWIGITIGLVPPRRLVLEYLEEFQQGVKREKYEFPRWQSMVLCISTTVMIVVGFVLAT